MTKYSWPRDDIAGAAQLKSGDWVLYFEGEHPLLVGRTPDGHWRCAARLALTDAGDFVAYSLEMRPWTNNIAGIGAATLSNVPLHRWLAEAHSRLSAKFSAWLSDGGVPARPVGPAEIKRLRGAAQSVVDARVGKPGPKGRGPEFYRQLALDYLELQGKGFARGIRSELASLYGTGWTNERIGDALDKATKLGFLAKGTSGRAGRFPGPGLYPTDDKEE